MSDPTITVALITSIAGIIGLIIKSFFDTRELRIIRADTREAKDQVANTHTINFRDDIDQKVDAILARMDESDRRTDARFNMIQEDLTQIRRGETADREEHTSLWAALRQIGGKKE